MIYVISWVIIGVCFYNLIMIREKQKLIVKMREEMKEEDDNLKLISDNTIDAVLKTSVLAICLVLGPFAGLFLL